MRAVFLPSLDQNPYQRELASALLGLGVEVSLAARDRHPVELYRERRFDVLHLHWIHDLVLAGRFRKRTARKASKFVAELLLLKALGVRIVWTVHNLVEHERRDERAELLIYRGLVRFLDGIIVHCGFARNEVMRLYRVPSHRTRRIHVVPHAHYAGVYTNEISREQARARLGYEETHRVFLYFGQLRRYKGTDRLLEAFARVAGENDRLLMVGGSPKNELIRPPTDPRIQVMNAFVPDAEVPLYFRAADVAVLPFSSVLTSGSLVLAMSFGLPVVAPRMGCLAETVDADGGVLYADEDGLVDALRKISARDDLAVMGARNRTKALAWGWKEAAAKTLDVYKRVPAAGRE